MGRRRKKNKQSQNEQAKEHNSAKTYVLTPEVIRDIESWALEACDVYELELFDIDVAVSGRWIIRVYADTAQGFNPGQGITIDGCANISRYLEAILDADDRIPEAYLLEVSSPGIERPLTKTRHVVQVIGQHVELNLREAVDKKQKVVGELISFENDILEIRQTEKENNVVEIPWNNVAKAKLKYDFSGVKER